MVYYPELGLTDNEVAYSVALLLLTDARVNNLVMPGFPSVTAELVENNFEVFFEKNGHVSKPLTLTTQEAKRLHTKFINERLSSSTEPKVFDKIQNIAAKFEGWG